MSGTPTKQIPWCHRNNKLLSSVNQSYQCVGSYCALWVPAVILDGHETPMAVGGGGHTIAKGWCADNLRCPPWDDASV